MVAVVSRISKQIRIRALFTEDKYNGFILRSGFLAAFLEPLATRGEWWLLLPSRSLTTLGSKGHRCHGVEGEEKREQMENL